MPIAWARRNGVRVVLQCHTSQHVRYFFNAEHRPLLGLRYGLRARYIRHNLLAADAVLACSHDIALLTADYSKVHPDRFEVIPHAFSREAQPGLQVVSSGEDDGYFLVVGNFEYLNGHDLLRCAYERHRAQGGNRTVRWAGPVAAPPAHSVPEGLCFLGLVPKEKLAHVGLRATAVAIASRLEPFSVVAGEAILNGCPLVLSRRAGWRDLPWRSQAALLAGPLDTDRFARALRLVEDPDTRERLEAGAKGAAAFLTLEELVLRTFDLYQGLVP